jgi:hypothetical protein
MSTRDEVAQRPPGQRLSRSLRRTPKPDSNPGQLDQGDDPGGVARGHPPRCSRWVVLRPTTRSQRFVTWGD